MTFVVEAPSPVAAVDSNPVARWTFDEGSGTSAADSVGAADGTLSGDATWLTSGAAVGSAAMDPGSDGFVDVPNDPGIEPDEFTVSTWIRSDGSTPPDIGDVIFEKGSFDCDGPSYGLYVGSDGLEFRYRRPMPDQDLDLSDSVSTLEAKLDDFWDGEWHLIGLGITKTGGRVYVSVDGLTLEFPTTSHVSQSIAVRYAGATHDQLRIGGPVDPTCGGGTFDGAIDDVRIYPDPIDVTRLQDLMPAIPTSLELASTGPLITQTTVQVSARISPVPRLGIASFRWIDPESGAIVGGTAGHIDADGNILGSIATPNPGPWILRVVFGGSPYVASTDDATVQVIRAPSETQLVANPATPVLSQSFSLIATVPDPPLHWQDPSGVVTFFRDPGPSEVQLGSASLLAAGSGLWRATLQVPSGLGVGSHTIVARYAGNTVLAPSESDPLTFAISESATSVDLFGATPVRTNHPVVMSARVTAPVGGFSTNATIDFTRVGTTTPSCSLPVNTAGDTQCIVSSLPVGTHQFVATYSGNSTHDPGVSQPWTVVVTADTVDASAVRRNYGTFYPYRDSYRDSVTMSGNRLEPLSVAIRIYSPSGTLVTSANLSRAAGRYAYAWNGRSSSGALRAPGRYRVVQTLRDSAGTSKAFASFVYISHKRIVTRTTYVTKNGSSVSARGDSGTGSISISTGGGYAKLTGTYPDGWVGVGYQFTLPSAVVYKSITFQAYAKGGLYAASNGIALQNFVTCPYASTGTWYEACFDHWGGVGGSLTAAVWTSASGHRNHNRQNRTVRGMVSVSGGTFTVYKVRVKVVYGVLR